ncbi:pyridoxal-phosphate dependent enzyme [Geodermatophilus nigrescens]|uniref:D-cysteine desulfhydrase n=1 Tax=Geodermatophilus nigrescens TaxID=1070870 RepID=A0A1M5DJ34_9ACTN|nr:pyridoxal-phosphate dependent enzyme [Geodermatophilus nigrescens]SHF66894.1 D-cysteine desulfhydrase [Geodermatophilus nigrescens]
MTVPLSAWPTPLHPAPRLSAALGLAPGDLVVKRDDLTDLGGGNKVRKLEHLAAEAVAAGATVLVTSGGVQSNHARMTAAAAARLGLRAVLVLGGEPSAQRPGNLALDAALGARVVVVPDPAAVEERVAAVAAELRAGGEVPAVLPLGGSSATGARGYLACAAELEEQAPGARHVVVAVGSGGTMAGLVAGLGADRVLGVDTGAVPDPAERVAGLVTAIGGSAQGLRLRRDQVGDGYGARTDAAVTALRTAARTEGLLLDPVYTAKALAGLAAAVADGSIRRGERTVFVHTGGLPGLFGHPVAAELAGEVVPAS